MLSGPKTSQFEGGAQARQDIGSGIGIGWVRYLGEHFSLGAEASYLRAKYNGTATPGAGNTNPAASVSGDVAFSTLHGVLTYYMLSGRFTPLLSAGVGITTVDAEQPAGLAGSCYYYPYGGRGCSNEAPGSITRASYMAATGAHWDVGRQNFVRGVVAGRWIDYGGATGMISYVEYRIVVGGRF